MRKALKRLALDSDATVENLVREAIAALLAIREADRHVEGRESLLPPD
jgi:hypothetical protein